MLQSETEADQASSKRIKLDTGEAVAVSNNGPQNPQLLDRKGVAPIKQEYLLSLNSDPRERREELLHDDAAEAAIHHSAPDQRSNERQRKKQKGQNTSRHFGYSRDTIQLCSSRANYSEFSPGSCPFGESCRFEHDLRRYLSEGKRKDLETFDNGICPVWAMSGSCHAGWKCRWVGSHSEEVMTEDGRSELALKVDSDRLASLEPLNGSSKALNVVNVILTEQKADLTKRKMVTPKADRYLEWLEESIKASNSTSSGSANGSVVENSSEQPITKSENRALYVEPPLKPSEKRRLYFGPETPVLAPLTTQGNLPFRRLCIDLGAQITYSEMAMSLPLMQGDKHDWALLKAHKAELVPPQLLQKGKVYPDYDHSKDIRFGTQISANKPWQALKATEILTNVCPYLRVVDLNCGCPIDMVYKSGAGSALLDSQSKLEKMIRGMNAVSKEVPITCKIRTGTASDKPTASKLINRLILGGHETQSAGGPCGVAAITLHGRSRQQRYTKTADWQYIAQCASLIRSFDAEKDEVADTIREADSRDQPSNNLDRPYFLGNGDCYSHVDYFSHLDDARVDSVMIARGALIKPWIFEEIQAGQYLDKSASERLELIKTYARYGLDTWGSDEIGVGTTRRFLLEWLSFAYRYVPIGILERLPPRIQDRPPAFKGRNELETLMASDNYKDWIKLSDMFLGPAHSNFKFEPKHRSNAYEIDAEG